MSTDRYWGTAGIPPVLNWDCSGTDLVLSVVLRPYCTGAALIPYWYHRGITLVLYGCCTGAAVVLHWYRAVPVPVLQQY